MAYGSKTKYRRRYARKGRVARMAKGKTTAVQALAKSVHRLQRQVRGSTPLINYAQSVNVSVSADYQAIKLSDYSAWSRVFGTSANDDTGNKMRHLSFGIDTYITLENTVNEPDTTGFTVFLISLRDEIGDNFNQSTGDLNLAPNIHYVIQGGMVLLNKKLFKIHKMKRFTLTNHGQALSLSSAQTKGGTDARFYWKCSPRRTINCGYGDWRNYHCSQDPSDNFYMLVFNDNSSIDLQSPKCQMSIVHTVQSYN